MAERDKEVFLLSDGGAEGEAGPKEGDDRVCAVELERIQTERGVGDLWMRRSIRIRLKSKLGNESKHPAC